MLFEDSSWMDVEQYLERDDRVVVVVGACEQHGYLSLLSDLLIPLEIAREACRREGVLIAPPLPYGISPSFVAYPGTLTLRPETYVRVVRDVVEGLLIQGFRRVLVTNGHGGNTGLLTPVLVDLDTRTPDAHLALFQYWQSPAVAAVIQESGLPGRHANWSENFPFTRLGPVPQGDKGPVDVPHTLSAVAWRAALGDGSFGGAYQAPDEVVERFFAAAVEATVTALKEL